MLEVTGDAGAGRGRLAEVIALRGGNAAPESAFVIAEEVERFRTWIDTGSPP